MRTVSFALGAITGLMVVTCVTTTSATILTFDVQQGDAWVGNGKNIPDTYGTDVTAADTPDGDYLQGNGWTPEIAVSYLPVRGVDPCTGEGTPDGVPDAPITVVNAGFNDGDPHWESPVSGWVFASSEAGFAASRDDVGGDFPGPNEGIKYLHISRFTWIYQKTAHPLTPGESYTVSLDMSDMPSNTGWLGVSLVAGDTWSERVGLAGLTVQPGGGPGQLSDTEWRRFSLTFDTTDPANIALTTANEGDPIWIRITAGPYQNPGDTEVFCDDVQLIVNGTADQYAARTYQDANWPAVAQLKWVSLDNATWDIVFTPNPALNVAVDINSFELDPYDDTGNESGTWSLVKDYGIIIDSGSWSNLAANQVVEVDMQPDGYYDGTVTLRLTVTGGTSGNMAVDNINFDVIPLDCNAVHAVGADMAADIQRNCRVDESDLTKMVPNWLDSKTPATDCEAWGHDRGDITNDCSIDGDDFGVMASEWGGCNDLAYRDKKLVYFGWDFMSPSDLQANVGNLQDRPFDGLVIYSNWAYTFYFTEWPGGGGPLGYSPSSEASVMEAIDNWGRFTDNFMYMVSGMLVDWFDDNIWAHDGTLLNNARAVAQIAAAGGCKGVFFDAEMQYWGTTGFPWRYNDQIHTDTYSFEEYEAKVRERGVQYINAIEEEMPELVFLTTFFNSYVQLRDIRTESDFYGLWPAFMAGVLEGANSNTRIIDGDEQSYYYGNEQKYRHGHLLMTESIPGPLNDSLDYVPAELHSKYHQQVECGHAVYTNVTLTPELMENRVFWALDSSDGYVWFYSESPILYLDDFGVDPAMPPAIISAREGINAGANDGCPPPTPYLGPAAHWKLDETSGSIAFDTTPNAHDAALNNFPGDDSQWVAGQVDGALSFDGINDYVSTPHVIDPSAGPFTACAWVQSSVPNRKILSQTNGSGTGRTWLYTDASGNLASFLGGVSMASYFHTTDGQWHHVALVWDGTRRYLYGDGNNLIPDAYFPPEACDGVLHIGATKNGTGTWNGLMDDVRIYDRALSPQEIADLHNAGL